MQHFRSGALLCALTFALPLLFDAYSHASPPKVDFLFPCGGQAGQTVALEVIGKADRWPLQVASSCDRIALSALEDSGKFTATISADAPPGVHWIRLFDAQGATRPIPFVVDTLPETTEQEPNNGPLKPQLLSSEPIIVNGRLERNGDVDHFAIELKQGATLVASVESHRLGSALDASLQIVSSDGFVLSHNDDDQGLDPRIIFVAPRDGTFVVRVFGFPADPSGSIALAGGANYFYRLTLTTHGFLDYALPLAIHAGKSSPIRLVGWNLPSDAQQRVATNHDDATSYLLFTAGVAGRLSLPVEPHTCIVETEPNPLDSAQPFEAPVSITGQINPPGDEDCFRFAATDQQQLSITVQSRSLGYPLDPVLEILDAEGKSLARVDDVGAARDPRLDFTAPAAGEYRVRVTDLHRTGSPRHVYRLRVTPTQADFRLTVAADQFSAATGTTLEIPVTIERLHGFAHEIAITVEGAPQSVNCPPATSVGEGDSSKSVTLSLSTGDVPYAGPIRIVGRVTEPEPKSQVAAIAGQTQPDSGVWLTISAAKE